MGVSAVRSVGLAAVMAATVHIESDVMQIPIWVEMFTVIAASAAGAMTARTIRLDLLGTITLAIVTGLSGGLIRDLMMQVGDVYMLRQPLALPASCVTAIIIFFVPLRGRKVVRALQVIDILNVGLYAAMGTDKAFAYGFDVPACILLGAFTGVGGGFLRDICLSVTPALFTAGGNFYGLAAICGSGAYIVARIVGHLDPMLSAVACVVVTIVLRWVSVRFDIRSPEPIDLPNAAARKIRARRTRGRVDGVDGGDACARRGGVSHAEDGEGAGARPEDAASSADATAGAMDAGPAGRAGVPDGRSDASVAPGERANASNTSDEDDLDQVWMPKRTVTVSRARNCFEDLLDEDDR